MSSTCTFNFWQAGILFLSADIIFHCCCFLFRVLRPTREFFSRLARSTFPVKGCKYWPILALIAVEEWGFFSMPQLLWHWASVYNGYLRGPVALTPVSSGAVTTFFATYVCRGWDKNNQPSNCEPSALSDCATAMWRSF